MKKIARAIPFMILGLMLIVTWYKFITHENIPILEHYLALGAAILNLALYFIRFKYGVLLTGVLLFLGVFGLLVFSPLKYVISYGITIVKVDINTPYMEWKIFLLLILYAGINAVYIGTIFTAMKRGKTGGISK